MSRRKKFLKYKKERVVLSDVLPYEVPITFSNRYFYNFLIDNNIAINGDKITIGNNESVVQLITRLMFGIDKKFGFNNNRISFKQENRVAIPFNYKIMHKETDFRELTIIHPKNQLCLIDFYSEYKDLILYYCSLSSFSIRKPSRTAKFTYFKDRLHIEKMADSNDGIIEQDEKEYENLKSFFVYKKYSNIHKFYESYQYHRCEKKYNKLFTFDISKCFNSIYTHSIAWALIDKEVIKKFLSDRQCRETFGHKFDVLMQKLNYNETNGIVIGPEFSRIFSELILQKIDFDVENELTRRGVRYKQDYEIFRYVDDYFVFYNDDDIKDLILTLFRLKLKDYKLYLNDSKSLAYNKPIITNITIAKQKISILLNEFLKYDIEKKEEVIRETGEVLSKSKGTIFLNSNKLITEFKITLSDSDVDYKDILNYSFSIIERKLEKVIKTYFAIEKDKVSKKQLVNAVVELLDFIFFLYAVSPRVNTTIKLCRILRLVTELMKVKKEFNIDQRHHVFKKIYDNIFFILGKNKTIQHTQVETLYLLIALQELGNEYWLTEKNLRSYLGVEKDKNGKLYSKNDLSYFLITVSIFYMKDKVRYNDLREFIKDEMIKKVESIEYELCIQSAENIFLLFDMISCPYIERDIKRRLLRKFEINDIADQDSIIDYKDVWFTNWFYFDFGKELDAKHSQNVY